MNKGLKIYLFHGIVEKSDYQFRNYFRKHLEKDYFYRFLKGLKGTCLSMDEIVALPYPQNAYAITFDDGFENAYSIAVPILKDLRLSATFYITTDFVNRNQMAWVDKLEFLIDRAMPKDKIAVLDFLRDFVKNGKISLPDMSSDDPLYKKMSWEQVESLNRDKDFIIGGHTHTHANLNFCANPEQEIAKCLEMLKEHGIKTRHFSYPEGLENCFNDNVIKILKNEGIVCCPTAITGINTNEDLFHLKRMEVK